VAYLADRKVFSFRSPILASQLFIIRPLTAKISLMTSHTTKTKIAARWLAASVIAAGIGTAITTGSAVVSADTHTHDSDTQQQIGQQHGTGGVVPEPPSAPRKNTTSANIQKKFSQTSDPITANMK
jgi:hypothetical protein